MKKSIVFIGSLSLAILLGSCSKLNDQEVSPQTNKQFSHSNVARDEGGVMTYYIIMDTGENYPCSTPVGSCMAEVVITAPKKLFMQGVINAIETGSTATQTFFSDVANYGDLSVYFTDQQITKAGNGTYTIELTNANAAYKTFIFREFGESEIAWVVPLHEEEE